MVSTKSAMTATCCVAAIAVASLRAQAQWQQWGGPDHNFTVASVKLASKWPEAGPPKVWQRDLGSGYSSIVADGGALFTMYRKGTDEIVVSLDAESGKTNWEHAYPAPVGEYYEQRFGLGPNATPLVVDGRVYTIGFTAKIHCLEQKTGKVIWSLDPGKKFGVKPPEYGASSSPILYKGKLIVVLGGENNGIAALSPDSGDVVWKRHSFENVFSTPVVINVGGQDQLALLASEKIVGLDPNDGNLLWEHEHVNQWKTNISTPVWAKDGTLYVSSGGDAGARMLKLSRTGGKTTVEEVWTSKKMQVGRANAIRVADRIYGSAGGEASFIGAADARTGRVTWRQRGLAEANMLFADGKLIILDEDGVLALAKPGAEKLEVLSQFQLFEDRSWTVPTLVGRLLFVRNNQSIIALDLG